MGSMTLQLPEGLSTSALADLHLASLAGGLDHMPTPTRSTCNHRDLQVARDSSESGYLSLPWQISDVGKLWVTSSTLIERPAPYRMVVELARGKINQLRNQLFEWRSLGLAVPGAVERDLAQASRLFARSITDAASPECEANATESLRLASAAAISLGREYCSQVLQARNSRDGLLSSRISCRLNGPFAPDHARLAKSAFNGFSIPMLWRQIEPINGECLWKGVDEALATTQSLGLTPVAGPLIDFSAHGIPEWIWEWQDDLPSITSFMCDYVETVVRRYHRQIRRWQLTASSNIAGLLQLNEDDQLWLTARLAETAWDVDSGLEITIGVAQPWGDYLAQEEHTCSPLIFADNLIRAGLRLAAIDLEWIFGVMPRGTYCRDLLDASRLLDMYAMLGTPLDVTLGYPSAWTPDPLADPALSPGAGYWLSPLSPQSQAEWVRDFLKLAIGKPFVRGVTWAHWSDALPHQFPHCGLIDSSGEPKPALEAWRSIRAAHAK